MAKKEDIKQKIEDKKKNLSSLSNELLNLYRKLLEEKIDYRKENKYEKPILAQREKIKNLEAEIRELDKLLKNSGSAKIKKKLNGYSKVKKKAR